MNKPLSKIVSNIIVLISICLNANTSRAIRNTHKIFTFYNLDKSIISVHYDQNKYESILSLSVQKKVEPLWNKIQESVNAYHFQQLKNALKIDAPMPREITNNSKIKNLPETTILTLLSNDEYNKTLNLSPKQRLETRFLSLIRGIFFYQENTETEDPTGENIHLRSYPVIYDIVMLVAMTEIMKNEYSRGIGQRTMPTETGIKQFFYFTD